MDQAKETTLNNSMVKVKFAMWKYQMKEIFCGKELWGNRRWNNRMRANKS